MRTHAARKSEPPELRDRKVVVLGLARSGTAAAELLHAHGARVIGVDEGEAATALLGGDWARRILDAGHATADPAVLEGAALLVLSPGVPTLHPLVRAAVARGTPVLSEIELAYRFCPAPVLAVTGSKGKSTTTALIGALLDAAGVEHIVAGNIGVAWSAVVERLTPRHWAVLEISSFQLETVDSFHAHAAVLLHVSPDHLDRYDSMEAYAAAKTRITRHQTESDWLVVDPGNAWGERTARAATARVAGFGRTWGGCGVTRVGDAFVWHDGDQHEMLAEVGDVPLLGEHNRSNVMAALAVVRALGLWTAAARDGLRRFPGLEYRMQPCGEIAGVRFVNDAKSTTVESVRAAVLGLPGPLVLALGGRNKGLDWTTLGADLGHVRAVLVFGEASEEITRQLGDSTAIHRVADLSELVQRALELGRPGDTVLFSPGCTSFDMFQNAEQRGAAFTAAVRAATEGSRR